jgi:hypothetical protein
MGRSEGIAMVRRVGRSEGVRRWQEGSLRLEGNDGVLVQYLHTSVLPPGGWRDRAGWKKSSSHERPRLLTEVR